MVLKAPNKLAEDIYQVKADEIIENIKTRYITRNGYLSEKYPVTEKTLFDNFDDLVPFFLHFNQDDFLISQIRKLRGGNETIVSMCSQYNVLLTRRIDEWFGGLYGIWLKTKDSETFSLIEESMAFVEEYLINEKGLSAAYFPHTKRSADFQEMWSSGVLETFIEMRREFPKSFLLAKNIMRAWCESEFFTTYSLFPYRIYNSKFQRLFQKNILSKTNPSSRFKRPTAGINVAKPGIKDFLKEVGIHYFQNGYYCQLMKSNSTCAFTLLELFKTTQEEYWKICLEKWIEAAFLSFTDNGCVYMEYYPTSKKKQMVSTTASFILIDVMCDSYYFLDEDNAQYLERSQQLLDYLWDHCRRDGLICRDNTLNVAEIDNQVDVAVSMRRYAELSGDLQYKDKAKDIMCNTLERFWTNEGYLTYWGEVENNPIDPKYNALLLKGIINLMTMNENIYPELHDLFKDR